MNSAPCQTCQTASIPATRQPVVQPKVIPLMTLEEGNELISQMPRLSSAEMLAMMQRNLGHSMPLVLDRFKNAR